MRKAVVEAAADRIGLILEEYSRSEIAAAIRLLRENGIDSSPFKALAPSRPKRSGASGSTPKRDPKLVRSKATTALKETDPAKFEVLSEFEKLLREGQLYPQTADLRTLGDRLEKGFPDLKNRRDLISRLMGCLAQRSLDEIRAVVKDAIPAGERARDEYHKLATYIIRGSE